MKPTFQYKVYGDISGKLFAKTVEIWCARKIARFFLEKRIRIEHIKTGETVEYIENED